MASLPTRLIHQDEAGNSLYSPLRHTIMISTDISTPPLRRFDEVNYKASGQILPLKSSPNIQTSLNSYRNIYHTPASSSMSQAASNISIISISKLTKIDLDPSNILLTKTDAFINICKCFTGASLFAIPWAFKQSGMLFGGISLLLLAFMTYYTLYWIAQCGHMHPTMDCPTYPDIAYIAFGRIGFYIAWIAILCMTIGVCSSYLVFIGSQLATFLNSNQSNAMGQNLIIFMVAIPIIFLSFFRSYRFLVPFNILGLISLIYAIIIVLYESTNTLIKHNYNYKTNYYYNNIGDYPFFLGNAAFAFLIHSVILPIEENMKDRKRGIISNDYIKALNYAIIFVTVLFLMFAEYVYFAFGNNTCGNIMDNLNENKWYTKLVIISLCVNLFFTYPLFLFPMVECLEMTLFNLNNNYNKWIETKRNILRAILVLITCGISVGIPDFEKLTGLTGAFGNNVLGLILPPIMYFKLVNMNNRSIVVDNGKIKIKSIDRIIGYFCTVFGIGMLIICTYSFVYSIIYDSNNKCS